MKYVCIKKINMIPLIVGDIYEIVDETDNLFLPSNNINNKHFYSIDLPDGELSGISEDELNEHFEELIINRYNKIKRLLK